MDNEILIQEALNYISKNNSLVEIKEYAKWNKQGIVKGINKIKTDFPHDKLIEFIDGSKVIINL